MAKNPFGGKKAFGGGRKPPAAPAAPPAPSTGPMIPPVTGMGKIPMGFGKKKK